MAHSRTLNHRSSSFWFALGCLALGGACDADVIALGDPGLSQGVGARDGGLAPACFEIFPTATGTGPDASTPPYHRNPLTWNLGTVPAGAPAVVSLRYYNFCSDPNATALAVEILNPAGGAADPSFRVTAAPPTGTRIAVETTVQVTFDPQTPGHHEATVRFWVSHGYYETRLSGTGSAP